MSISEQRIWIVGGSSGAVAIENELLRGRSDLTIERKSIQEFDDHPLHQNASVVIIAGGSQGWNSQRWKDRMRMVAHLVPFVIVVDDMLVDEAVCLMKSGAFDVLTRGRLPYLSAVIEEAIEEHVQRRERERAWSSLQSSEYQFAEAQTIAKLGSWWWIPQSGEVGWTDATYALFGLERHETPPSYEAFLALLHPDDRPKAIARVEAMLAGANEFASDLRVIRGDGNSVWIHSRARARRNREGQIIRVDGIDQDVTERKRVESELQRTHELLQAFAEGIPDAVFVKDREGKYLLLNAAAERFVGKSAEQVLGRDDTVLFEPSDAQIVMDNDRRVMSLGVSQTNEENLTAAGVNRIYLATKTPYRDGDKKIIGVLGISRDITKWKLAEMSLRESEQRYRRLVDMIPNAVFINLKGVVVFCNQSCVELFGARDSSEILGKTPFDLFHPDFHALMRERIDRMQQSQQAAPALEEKIVRMDGRIVPVNVVATPITDRGESAILVALSDLTENERSANLLRSVLGSVNDAILTIDERGIIESANAATLQMFGYAESDLLGHNVRILMPAPYRENHVSYVANYLTTGIPRVIGKGREVMGRRKDGSTFPLELTVAEFQLENTRHFTGVLRDITERKKLEDQFYQAQKMEAIGLLAGGVAHDFNNLLTVINGCTEMVLSDIDLADTNVEKLKMVSEAGQRAAALTAQLLAFSRKSITEPKLLDMNEVLSQLGKLLRRLIREDIALTLNLASRLPLVRIDPSQLEQVIMNLIVNARDAMPSGGKLSVETSTFQINDLPITDIELGPGQFVRLQVQDSGVGMSQEVQSRIFEPFFTTKPAYQGTGLGLATAYGIIKQAKGSISVESEHGRGTVMTVLLPAASAMEAPLANRVCDLETLPRGTETVFIVEDEGAVLRLVSSILTSLGYRVLTATSGRRALSMAAAFPDPIHLLLTDVGMSELNGRELAEQFRSLRPNIQVLFMSGYVGDSVLRYGIETAATGFLQKPFSPWTLARKIRDTLNRA